jgi:hypothetical protein
MIHKFIKFPAHLSYPFLPIAHYPIEWKILEGSVVFNVLDVRLPFPIVG